LLTALKRLVACHCSHKLKNLKAQNLSTGRTISNLSAFSLKGLGLSKVFMMRKNCAILRSFDNEIIGHNLFTKVLPAFCRLWIAYAISD
jgi:hypothetical protein